MAEIIGFKHGSNVVEDLEQLLAHAKNGEIIGFAAVAILNDGNIIDGYAGVDNDVLLTISGLRILEHRLIKAYVEIPED